MKELVAWQCDKCGVTMTGFLEAGESTERGVCGRNYAKGKKQYPLRAKRDGEIVPYRCKGTMQVILDQRTPNAV